TCAKEIAADIQQNYPNEMPADPTDEHSYDSDNYPKGPFFDEESDAPEHCAGCHIFLENPLTSHGQEYMMQMVDGAVAKGRGDEPHIKEWMDFYEYHPEEKNMEDAEEHEASAAGDATKEAAGQNFDVSGLSQDQITVACACLNMSPEQGKPEASAENLSFFQTPFVYEALEEALAGNKLTPAGVEVANSILSKKEACMASKQAAISQPTSGEDEGFNVKVVYNKYGITLEPTANLLNDVQGIGETINKPSIWELMEDFFTNGWEMVNPEDIGALTSGEIMSDQDGNIYWHERYQIEDMVEMLMNGEKVNLQYGGNIFEEEGVPPVNPASTGTTEPKESSATEQPPDPKKAPQKPKERKEATGEMSQSEADNPEEWPIHHAIAKALGGTVKAFDQYQGPYILVGSEVRGRGTYAPAIPMRGTVRLWVQVDEGSDGAFLTVDNEDNEKVSEPFHWEDMQGAVDAAKSVLDQPKAQSSVEKKADMSQWLPERKRLWDAASELQQAIHQMKDPALRGKAEELIWEPLGTLLSAILNPVSSTSKKDIGTQNFDDV